MALNLPIVVDFDGRGLKRAVAEFKKLETNAARAQFIINKSALPAAAALGGLAVAAMGAAKAAAEDQQAQVQLAGQIQRTTGATNLQIQANEAFITTMSQMAAVSDDELRPALASLVTGTKDLQYAQRLLKVALDVSAGTGLNLQSVSEALSRGFNGNTRSLGRLSPELKKLVQEGGSFADVLKVLEANFGGAAKEAANTAGGGMRKFQIAMDEAQEAIGTALLPYMEQLVPLLVSGAKWFERNAKAVTVAVLAFGSIATVLLATKAALAVYNIAAAATTVANTALATSGFAVQISTGIGIASAIAGAAALTGIALTIKNATKANYDYAASTAKVTEETGLMKVMIDRAREAADRRRATEAAAAKAAEQARTTAEKARSAATSLFTSTKKALADARQSLRDYAKSLADAVSGYVSLSSAVQDAKDREQEYSDALAERVAAYEELNKLQRSGVASTEALADASERVAKAEQAVTTAQGRRTNYAAQFRDQIEAAKKFSGQLQTLIAQGLSRAGLAQLMNLGPVAGSQVAADLIAGTSGMTAASLSADLASLDIAGAALGSSAIAGDMSLLGQAGVGRTGNNVYITVQGGDPNAVVAALRRYMQVNGSVPIRVSG